MSSAQKRALERIAAKVVAAPKVDASPSPLLHIGDILDLSLSRAERRATKIEKPIPLPWPVLAPHFGGGLWPGVHYVTAGTGVGKTTLGLQLGLHAAKSGFALLYVGLEMAELDVGLRLAAEETQCVRWSSLWTGTASAADLRLARRAAEALKQLPIHVEFAKPNGYPPSALREAMHAMRTKYPEVDGPGSSPVLVVVDFLQLMGDEPGESLDLRVRVGRVAYALRELSSSLGLTIVAISSAARDKKFSDVHRDAKLTWDDVDGHITNRRIGMPDAIVGFGKESGEIEYSGDSVSIMAKVPATDDRHGVDVIFATAKGRATGAMWSPLHFTGYRYVECADGGARMVAAWAEEGTRRERAREEKREAKETAREAKVDADASAILDFVRTHPGCTVRAARVAATGDSGRRWNPAFAKVESFVRQERAGARTLLYVHDEP